MTFLQIRAAWRIVSRVETARKPPRYAAAICFLVCLLAGPRILSAQEISSASTSNQAYPPRLSGTVVDTSGAVIGGATVQVRSMNGTGQRTTQSDPDGSFIFRELSAGRYRLVVS